MRKLIFDSLDSRLHVLFLCGWYPSRVLPTNGDFVERHAEAVGKKHKVTILHIITDNNLSQDIEIISKEEKYITTYIAYLKSTNNPLTKIILFRKAFLDLLKKIEPFDIVHLNEVYPFGIFSLYLKWFKNKRFIISEHWTDYKYPLSNKIGYFQKTISKSIVKNASFICPVTKDLENSMLAFNLKGNYRVIGNVVNTDKFYPKTTKNAIFSIVHISNMDNDHKNIVGILNVVKKLQDQITHFNIKIIGKDAKKHQGLADKLSINSNTIQFIDQIPHEAVISHLQNANLFVLFSNFENLPCVILESFACGIPVISTNVGGISEHFPENFGKLIPAKDEQGLYKEVLNYYHTNHILATKENMHNYIHIHFSENEISRKYTNLYIKTLNQ